MSNQIMIKHSPCSKAAPTGFTLFQVVLVIVIIGIIAAVALPKMLNLEDNANIASVKATAGALKSSINEARDVYLVKIGQGQIDNLKVFPNNAPLDKNHPHEQLGMLDFNSHGWPVQNYNISDPDRILLNNANDCVSLWRTVFSNHTPSVSKASTRQKTDYIAHYGGNKNGRASQYCRYDYRKYPKFFISYDAITGKVSSNTKPH